MEYNNWIKEEFKAFLLLYAAQTNFVETDEEIDYIINYFKTWEVEEVNILVLIDVFFKFYKIIFEKKSER